MVDQRSREAAEAALASARAGAGRGGASLAVSGLLKGLTGPQAAATSAQLTALRHGGGAGGAAGASDGGGGGGLCLSSSAVEDAFFVAQVPMIR